jgi:hypothetical protein
MKIKKQLARTIRFFITLCLMTTAALSLARPAFAATRTWDGGGADNNWSTCANWSADTCPTTADIVTFDSTSTKDATIDAGYSTGVATFNINVGYTGTITQARSFTVSGATTFAGAGTFAGNTSNLTFTGTYTQSSGTFTAGNQTVLHTGAWTLSGGAYTASPGSTTFNNNVTHTAGGTFAPNGGKVTFTGAAKTIDVATSETFYDLTFNNTSVAATTIATNDDLIATHNVTFTDGYVNATSGHGVQVQGNVSVGNLFDGGTAGLTFTGNGTQTWSGAGTAAFNGNVTINASGTVQLGAAVTLDSGSQTFTLTAGTFAPAGYTLAIVNYSQSGGTFTGGANTIDVNGTFTLSGGTFTATSNTLTVGDTWTHTAGGTFAPNGGKVTFTGAAKTIDVATSETFYDLTFNNTSVAATTIATNDDLIATHNVTFTDGYVNATSGHGVQVQGNVSVENLFDGGTAGLTFTGNGTQAFTLTSATGLYNGDVTVNKTVGTAVQLTTAFTADAVNQDLIITSGTLDINGFTTIVNGSSGTFTVAANGTLQMQGSETITTNATYPSFAAGATAKYTATSGPITMKDYTYSNLVIAGGTSVRFLLPAAKTFNNVTITTGILDAAGQTMTINGSFSNDDTLRLKGTETLTITMDVDSGTVMYVGDNDGVANENFTIRETGATDFYNLRIADNNATQDNFVLGAALTVAGTLSVTDGKMTQNSNVITATAYSQATGTFVGGASNIDINGNFDITAGTFTSTSGTLYVSGNFSNAGTFTHSSGTVVLDGTNQTLSGATIFNVLTKSVTSAATLTLPASTTQTIVGALTLNGSSGQKLSLRSSSPATQASIDPQNTRTISYLDVQDSNNVNATAISCLTSCTNSLNNTNWAFSNPGVTITESNGTTITERGTTDTYTVVLDSLPANSVTVSINPDDQVSVSNTSLTFTIANWSTPQTITVSAINDSYAEGSHSGTITHTSSSSDSNYNGITITSVTATITDDDTAGFIVSTASGHTTEAETTATFTVIPTSQPTASVTVPISSADTTEGIVSAASLTFTTGNWNTPQTITVTGIDDLLDDGDMSYIITLAAITSADLTYNGLNPSDVTVINDDDDTSGFSVSAISGNTSEAGSTATFTIILTAQPTASVTVDLSSSDATEGSVSPSSFTFTTDNWNVLQTATVTGTNDNSDDGDVNYSIITGVATSSDTNYNNINPGDVTLTNTDNDTTGVTVNPTSGNTTEAGGTSTFTVVLTSQPSADVVIPVVSNNTAEGTVSSSSLTFTSLNWDTQQTVTVTGVDDNTIDGTVNYTITLADATSVDLTYHGFNPTDVSMTSTDNDSAAVLVTQSDGTTAVAETGATDSYTLVLTAQPTTDVVITVTPVSPITSSVPTVTFTHTNWSTPQTITVGVTNDAIAEGAYSRNINHSSASLDTAFNGLFITTVSVAVTDNDTADITVGAISGSTSETGSSATFTLVLTSEPTANVELGLSSSNTNEGTVSPTAAIFTSLNWNTPQTITVTGVNDAVSDGTTNYTIVIAAAVSTDPGYNGLNPTDVTINNTDNDTVGFTVTESDGTTLVTESGTTDAYTIVLNSQPTASVSVFMIGDGDITTSPSSITFTTLDWATPQVVTVSAIDDTSAEGSEVHSVLHIVTSSDSAYAAATAPGVPTTVTDNDSVNGGGGGGNNSGSGSSTSSPSISVKHPVSNDIYGLGTLTVSWSWTGTIPAVNVYLSWDGGTTWSLQRYLVTNTGATQINLDRESMSARIKIEGTDFIHSLVSEKSDSFTVSANTSTKADDAAIVDTPSTLGNTTEVAARVGALPASVTIHDLVKVTDDGDFATQADSTVYYVGADGYRHAFPNSKVFSSWYCNQPKITIITAGDLAKIPLGTNIIYRPGSKLVKFVTDPRVYAVDTDGSLRWILSEDAATAVYGSDWRLNVDDIEDVFYRNYRFGAVLTNLSWNPIGAGNAVSYPSDVMRVPGYIPVVGKNPLCEESLSTVPTLSTASLFPHLSGREM